jgi:hypothetical protein
VVVAGGDADAVQPRGGQRHGGLDLAVADMQRVRGVEGLAGARVVDRAGGGMRLDAVDEDRPLFTRPHQVGGRREDILDRLLKLLEESTDPGNRNDLRYRSRWIWLLEQAASTVESRLPASLGPYDQATGQWVTQRARGAATALRQLKRHITAPSDRSWDRLTAELHRTIVALTTGDFGTLRWSPPPDPARTAVFAAVPLLAAGPLLHPGPTIGPLPRRCRLVARADCATPTNRSRPTTRHPSNKADTCREGG